MGWSSGVGKYTDAEAIVAAKTVKLDDFATPDDNTDLDASTTEHGLLLKLDNSATNFLNGQGAWAVPGGGPSQADQAALAAETSEGTFAPPDLIRHSPGVAKVWVYWEQTGAHSINDSYNMTSVTDGGAAGDTDHLWDADFSTADYAIVFGANTNAGHMAVSSTTQLAGGVTSLTQNQAFAGADIDRNALAAFGVQV